MIYDISNIKPLTKGQIEHYGIPEEIAQKHNIALQTHIAHVQTACAWLGVPDEQRLAHDQTKWSLEEFPAYAMKFHGPKTEEADRAFTLAWLHHENLNPHHWGYWIPRSGKAANQPLPMPEKYVREMVADWLGASKAYTGSWEMAEWVNKNVPTFNLHPETVSLIDVAMNELGYILTDNCPWSYMAGSNTPR